MFISVLKADSVKDSSTFAAETVLRYGHLMLKATALLLAQELYITVK